MSVGKISIENGKIIVSAAGSSAKPSIYQNVNLEASDLSYTSQFPFKLTATGPGNAAIKVEGKAGPIDAADASLTPLDAAVEVEHLDLANTGFTDASSGIAGVMDFKGTLSSDGKQMNAKGTVKANKLKVSATGAPSSVPLNIDYATTYDLKSRSGNLNQGDIHIGSALARLNGAYNVAPEPAKLDMRLNGQSMPVSDLEGFLPAVGVVVPPGSKLQGGSLTMNLNGKRADGQVGDFRASQFVECQAGGIQREIETGAAGVYSRAWRRRQRRWWIGHGYSDVERERAQRSVGNQDR